MKNLQEGTYISKSGEWKILVRKEKKRWSYQVQPYPSEFTHIFTQMSKSKIIENIIFYMNEL